MKEIHVYPDGLTSPIDLGRQGENKVREIVFHVGAWEEALGPGYVQLLFMRQGDAAPYPCAVIQENGLVRWTVTALETEQSGGAWVMLRYVVGDAVLKTVKLPSAVTPTLDGALPAQSAGVAETWLDRLLAQETTAAQAAAQAAEAATEEILSGYVTDAQTAAGTAGQIKDEVQELVGSMSETLEIAEAAQTAASAASEAASEAQETAETALAGIAAAAEAAATSEQNALSSALAAQNMASSAAAAKDAAEASAAAAQSAADTASADAAAGVVGSLSGYVTDAQTARDTAVAAAQAAVSATAPPCVPFTEDQWVEDEETGDYTLTIPPTQHGKLNGDFAYQLYQLVDGVYKGGTWGAVCTSVDYIDTNVVLTASEPYPGKIVLV